MRDAAVSEDFYLRFKAACPREEPKLWAIEVAKYPPHLERAKRAAALDKLILDCGLPHGTRAEDIPDRLAVWDWIEMAATWTLVALFSDEAVQARVV